MKISQANYEQYFLDYLDGNLSDREISMLEDFLLLNPSLREELEGLEKMYLRPGNQVYPEKDLLKKPDLNLPINEENFQDFCIAASESDLNEYLTKKFQDYIDTHPEKLDEYLIYNHLHLLPEPDISFPLISNLKKPIFLLSSRVIYVSVSIAAAIALFLFIYKKTENLSIPLENQITSNIPHKNEIQKENLEKIQNPQDIHKQIPDSKKPAVDKASLISIQDLKLKKTEETFQKNILENSNSNNQSELLKIAAPSIDMPLSALTPTDVDIPEQNLEIPIKVNKAPEKYLSWQEVASMEINKKILGKKENTFSKPTIWDVADAGIHGINRLTGSKMKLEKKTDKKGEIKRVRFESKLLSFSTSVNPRY